MQLYELIKARVERGDVRPGSKLPSSRSFAAELGVARSTVTTAYEQLMAEGYVAGRRGARLEVSDLYVGTWGGSRPSDAGPMAYRPRPPLLLTPGVPDLRLFPCDAWIKATARSWRSAPDIVLGEWDPAGTVQLRRALASHLREWRGIEADSDQIVITAGSTGALQLVLDSLTRRGDWIATEDPGYPAFHRLLSRRGVQAALLPVDDEGMDVDALRTHPEKPSLCFVTPSHQYPLGVEMSPGRRRRLIEWAVDAGAFIVEDDYDSQFRYDGRPVPALRAVSPENPVIYVGTTSKSFSPSLRIGYIVAPRHLVYQLLRTAHDLEQRASIVPQNPLAEMIESGDYARHLRRMRCTYRDRRKLLIGLLLEMIPNGHLDISPQAAGLHLVARFTPAMARRKEDAEVAAQCEKAEVGVKPLSFFYRGKEKGQGLLIGFAGFEEEELAEGVRRLSGALGQG